MSESSQDPKLARLFLRTLRSVAKLGPEAAALVVIHGGIHVGAHLLGAMVTTGSLLRPKGRRAAARGK